jgi:hypothetical protein
MARGRPADLPRALGWLLALAGGSVFGFMTFGYVFAGLAAGGFSTDAGSLILLLGSTVLGLLALIAGIRIIRAHPRNQSS